MKGSPEEQVLRMQERNTQLLAQSAEGMVANVLGQAVADLLAAGRETDRASLRAWVEAAISAPRPGLPPPWLEAALQRLASSPGTPADGPA